MLKGGVAEFTGPNRGTSLGACERRPATNAEGERVGSRTGQALGRRGAAKHKRRTPGWKEMGAGEENLAVVGSHGVQLVPRGTRLERVATIVGISSEESQGCGVLCLWWLNCSDDDDVGDTDWTDWDRGRVLCCAVLCCGGRRGGDPDGARLSCGIYVMYGSYRRRFTALKRGTGSSVSFLCSVEFGVNSGRGPRGWSVKTICLREKR